MTLIVLGAALLCALLVLAYREREHTALEREQAKAHDLERGALLGEKADLEQRFRSEQADAEDRHQIERELARQAYGELNDRVAAEREAWTKERSELLTRIQHPEVILPSIPLSEMDLPPREPEDEIDMIGTIVDGVENG